VGEEDDSGWLLTVYVAVMTALVLLPIVMVLLVSFTASDYIVFPPPSLSLEWYGTVFSDPQWTEALWLSIRIATLVTALSLALGVPAALGLRSGTGLAAAAAQTLFLSPLMVPTIVIGFALLRVFSMLHIGASALTVAIGQTILAIAYVTRLVLSSLAGVDPKLESAAAILGSSPWRTFWTVTFPLIRHGIIVGGLFSFIVSVDDVNIALFLSDVRTAPLSVTLFSYIEQNADPLGAAVSSLLVLIAIVLLAISDRIVGIGWLFGIRNAAR
jgi:putative spermidine/putrescine transport system permease protein